MSDMLDATTMPVKRPAFLTVLCILTFIGSGLGLIGGILGMIGSTALKMFAPEGTMIVQGISLVSAALCLFGAIKMWGLAKQGFMLYVVGSILSIVAVIVSAVTLEDYMAQAIADTPELQNLGPALAESANRMAVEMASAAAWTSVVITVIVNVLFIILYGVNRKHLVK